MIKYTPEQKDYISELAPGRYNSEIASLFNERYGTKVTEGQIKSFKANHGISSNVPRRRRTENEGLFSLEQIKFIEMNVHGLHNSELTALVNQTFNLDIKVRQMRIWKKNRKLSSGLKGTEGKAPPNKGTKGLYNVGGNRTSFKPGQPASNYKPVGSERIDQDGYTLVKVSDEGPWHKRWRHKHKVVWEEAHGAVPKGHVLIFADQDKRNITVDNIILVPQSRLSILNKKKLLHNNAELTRTGLIMASIYKKIADRKRSNRKKGVNCR